MGQGTAQQYVSRIGVAGILTLAVRWAAGSTEWLQTPAKYFEFYAISSGWLTNLLSLELRAGAHTRICW
jgi:hypothetical protein